MRRQMRVLGMPDFRRRLSLIDEYGLLVPPQCRLMLCQGNLGVAIRRECQFKTRAS